MILRMAKVADRGDIVYFHTFYTDEKSFPMAIIENNKGGVEFVCASWITFVDLPSASLKGLREVDKC